MTYKLFGLNKPKDFFIEERLGDIKEKTSLKFPYEYSIILDIIML